MNLAQKSHLLQELFNHATESIIAINNQGDIQLVNPATEKLFGYKQEELYGKKVEFLMPERFK
jgi:PAS domain S-box-containing protein